MMNPITRESSLAKCRAEACGDHGWLSVPFPLDVDDFGINLEDELSELEHRYQTFVTRGSLHHTLGR